MNSPQYNRYRTGILLYEARNQEDKVLLSVQLQKDIFKSWGIDAPGFMTFADHTKYLDPWIMVAVGKGLLALLRSKDLGAGKSFVLDGPRCRKFHIRVMYLGYDKTDKTHTIMICTERNKEYSHNACGDSECPHSTVDVSDDPV